MYRMTNGFEGFTGPPKPNVRIFLLAFKMLHFRLIQKTQGNRWRLNEKLTIRCKFYCIYI